MADDVSVRRLLPGDDERVFEAAGLFDVAPDPAWTRKFLAADDHHILIAYRGGEPAGFVSAVETTHPDKGTEMFLYELAVAPEHRRRGVAAALLRDLSALAHERDCYGMFVITDDDNAAALAAYRSSGAGEESEHVMLTWNWT